MTDPLTILGATAGITSLIIQLADECVKGFKLYKEAEGFPQTHHYLVVRLDIERQRFLNFAIEADLLNAEGEVCSILHINRSLLVGILAEVKFLFERFAAANGRYKDVTHASGDVADNADQKLDLMSYLGIEKPDQAQLESTDNLPSKRAAAARHVRGVGKSVTQTAKNLRTVIVEPKRLVWAALDQGAFEQLISKLDSLNTFLVSLLDTSQLQRLQAAMDTSYLEILQLRNDVGDLNTLVKALKPAAKAQFHALSGSLNHENDTFSRAVAEQEEIQKKREKYLTRLAEIKIQFTEISNLNDRNVATSEYGKFFDDPLSLSDFDLAESVSEAETLHHQTRTTYQGKRVFIEWRDIPATGPIDVMNAQVEWRIGLLTDLLRSAKPVGFRTAPCLGYLKIPRVEDATLFGIVFEEPLAQSGESEMTTLQDLLARQAYPSLGERLSLCAILARCVRSLHAVNWLHKALRPENIVFFSPPPPSSSSPALPDFHEPFLFGFELSRPSTMDQLTEKPSFDPFQDVYRHPAAQSSRADGRFRKSYDLYSLGVMMIEIALWKPIEDVVPLADLVMAKPSALQIVKPWLLDGTGFPTSPEKVGASCLQQVAFACGDAFRDVVRRCLTMDEVEAPAYAGEEEVAIALKMQRVMEQDIVRRLDGINSLLGE